MKRYDRAYFDRWYRREGFGSPARTERKVTYAVGAAEYLLDRRVRSVLDVGCGEGAWGVALRRFRPRVRYVGIDPSEYAVRRYGATRNVRAGGFGDLGGPLDLGPGGDGPFDLVVCVDVVPYVSAAEIHRGLRGLVDRLEGAAFLEVWTAGDDVVGDLGGFRRRAAAVYERWFTEAGLCRLGPHLYARRDMVGGLGALERPLSG